MSQLNPVKNASKADQIYFDITVSNFQSTTTQPPVFYFNEQRSTPFVMNPEDYYLSILRFTVETGTLPVFIPSIKPNSPNNADTIYSMTLEWEDSATGTIYTSGQNFVQYIPQDKSVPPPAPPSATANGLQNSQTGYFNVYNYSFFPLLIDQTFQTAFAALNAAVVGAGLALPTANAPVMNWDTTSDCCIAYFDYAGYSPNNPLLAAPNAQRPIKVYFNAPLFGLFPSFPCRYEGYSATLGKNFLFEPYNVGSVDIDTITPATGLPAYSAVKVYQEYSTIANFCPIVALVFTSNTLPIQPNQVSTPLVYNDSQELVLGGNNSDFANIITDLVSDTGQYKPNLTYNPSSEYRLITLYGNRPLSNIDIQVYWRDKYGQLNPFRLGSGEAITLKVAFLKKAATYQGKSQNENA